MNISTYTHAHTHTQHTGVKAAVGFENLKKLNFKQRI